MKFLIQKIGNEIRHDFTFALLESIRFNKWLYGKKSTMEYRFINTIEIVEPDDIYPPIEFKPFHKNYIPIGSVEFVTEFLQHFYGLTPKPINVPEILFPFAERRIFNGTHLTMQSSAGEYFVKSNDRIKGFSEFIKFDPDRDKEHDPYNIPIGNYQYSRKIEIDSEWRAFVYENDLVGLQNYAGSFRMFPEIDIIYKMIFEYKPQAPIAYTLDVALTSHFTPITIPIEVHDFFSCGLYGFADYGKLPHMFSRWFNEYLKNNLK